MPRSTLSAASRKGPCAMARTASSISAGAAATGKDGKFYLANPDTPEGYRYYKAQVDSLLAAYPQIGVLGVWFRNGNTPWTQLKLDEMPSAWQKEYAAEIAKTPEAAKLWYAPQMFAIGKIAPPKLEQPHRSRAAIEIAPHCREQSWEQRGPHHFHVFADRIFEHPGCVANRLGFLLRNERPGNRFLEA